MKYITFECDYCKKKEKYKLTGNCIEWKRQVFLGREFCDDCAQGIYVFIHEKRRLYNKWHKEKRLKGLI